MSQLTLEQIRKIDPSLSSIPDEELIVLVKEMYMFSDLLFDLWLDEQNVSKNPVGLLHDTE